MNRLRIEVEPLSEERWARIERSLFSRLPLVERPAAMAIEGRGRTLRSLSWLGAAAAALALVGLLFTRSMPAQEAELDHPTRVTTGETPSHLALPGLALDVEPDSAVVVGADTSRGLLLVLDRGSIACRVAKRASTDPLIVQAGAARVRVVGTRFSVTRLGESARVEVHEGAVEVTFDGKATRVSAGERWPSSEVAGPEPSATSEPQALDEASAPGPELDAPRDDPMARRRGSDGTSRERLESVARRRPEADPGTNSLQEDEAAAPPSSQAIFEQATALERSNPARASQLYAELQSGGDSWARNALYARGRLEASRGDRELARRLLQSYLERYPRGSNAEDARAVLKRLR